MSLSEILLRSQFGAFSCGGLCTILLLEEDRAQDHRKNGQQSPEKEYSADKLWSTLNISPQAETHHMYPSSPTLVWAAHTMVCGIREVYPVSVVLCFTSPPPFERACLLFSPNRRGIQLHLCRQALSPNLTSQREAAPRLKTAGIFETTNPGRRRPAAFKKLADFSC